MALLIGAFLKNQISMVYPDALNEGLVALLPDGDDKIAHGTKFFGLPQKLHFSNQTYWGVSGRKPRSKPRIPFTSPDALHSLSGDPS